jgi:hypothetical protein
MTQATDRAGFGSAPLDHRDKSGQGRTVAAPRTREKRNRIR